jgi:pyocin large subunit-like protein
LRGNRLIPLVIAALALAALLNAAGPGFRSKHLLEDQFERHGREFGHITQEQFVQMAQQLRNARPSGNILEYRRPDGVTAKFDRKHGYYGAYDADGSIRSFFVPPDGVRFFDRQTRRYKAE